MQVKSAINIESISLQTAWNFLAGLAEFSELATFSDAEQRVADKQELLCLGAINADSNKLVGVKIGYALDKCMYYSWMGGVNPHFRKSGIAQKLLDFQEEYVAQKGFQAIRVKSRNCHRAMCCFLLKNNYLITALEPKTDARQNRIIFHKDLI
jgi:ribosomal protein S18 acetylase RimI-like enzyme